MDDLKVLLRLLALFRPYRGWMLLGAFLASLTVLASVALMAVAGWFIAAMATAGMAGVLMNYFMPAAGIRAFAILRTGGRYGERVVSHEATFRLLARLRVWLFRKLVPLAPAQLQNHRGADLVSRIQADIDTLQHAYLRLYSPVVVALVGMVAIVAVLALFSPAVALAVLALLLVAGALVPGLVYRAAATPGADVVATRAELRVALVDALQGMTDLRVHGAQERMADSIARLSAGLGERQSRVARLGSLSEGMVGLCANLAGWSAAVLAMLAVGAGTLAPEQVPMLALAAFASFEAVAPLPLALQRVGEIAAAARRIFALADATPNIAPVAAPSPTPRDSSIHLNGVRMRYEATGPLVLDGIDLDIPAGRRLAVVGPSGAGKSSIARVLLRFWDYEAGDIRLGGHDLRAYRQDDLFRLIGVLSQDTQLLNASVRENLLVAAPQADGDAMERAMRAAQLHDFIMAQPHGYDTWIGEGGVRLSLGQARRLALARVLLRDPAILILDEPTEGLDAPTGRALMEAVVAAMAGRTVLVITHRPEEVHGLVDATVRLTQGRIAGR
ncbi:thiol reductant ABC exporter subunit CydC [Ancylobacter sp. G4_0304]|uniref:thiol reductant ABC exporter subunit CydC n=1 Tax=Ancylobacter sp. G4_0304 TaxID=3114289 RepID=UPI0039C5ADED